MLGKCLECNGAVSDRAVSCPHCGYPVPRPAALPVLMVFAFCGLVVAALLTPNPSAVLASVATIVCSLASLYRREQASAVSILPLVGAALLLLQAINHPFAALARALDRQAAGVRNSQTVTKPGSVSPR